MQNNKDKIFKRDKLLLKNYLEKNYSKFVGKNLNVKFVNKHFDELKNLIKTFDENLFKSFQQYLNFLNLNRQLLHCKNCGKYLSYQLSCFNQKHYFCSSSCSAKFTSQKRIQTNLKKYGVKNVFQNSIIKQKIKITNLKRYNVEYTGQIQSANKKRKQTLLNNYGVSSPLKNQQIKKKQQQTCLKKFGNQHFMKTQQAKLQLEKINLNKFGCLNHEFLDKWTHMNLLTEATPLFNLNNIENYSSKKQYKFKCNFCGNIFLSMWKCGKLTNHCNCLKTNISMEEKQLLNFCKKYFSKIIENSKKLIPNYELDIFIPEIRLAIEFNGIYWHNEDKKSALYHLNKTNLCEKQNIHLIHIWQDDWVQFKQYIKANLIKIFNNQSIIKNVLTDKLILDRCWFQSKNLINICNKTFRLEQITQPQLLLNNCYNCGKLIYKKI